MSYLVLARKYRPTTFSEVVGQEHVTRTLSNAFASGRVHHAFLFCGPRGCGKTTVARIVGKALNCEAMVPPSTTSEPCGKCAACASIGNGSAVDYQEMDGASNRGIDAIRELTEAVRYQPAVLRKKVYVIDEVHMLTTEAFNALLKTLEEPPPHVTFVLATTEPHKLPNTILSRCQRYDFKLVTASRLGQHLGSIFKEEKLPADPGAISLLVRESGGSVRDALSLSDQIISYVGDSTITEAHVAEVLGVADRSLTRSLVRALGAGDAGAALGAVESAIERGVDEIQLARAIVRYLRDLSVLQVAPERRELIDASDEERGDLAASAAELTGTRGGFGLRQMFDRMLRCCDELGKTSQPRLVLDCALIDVATIEPLVPLGDLIERLGDLEARIGRAGVRVAGGGGGGGARTPKATVPATPSGISRSSSSSSGSQAGGAPVVSTASQSGSGPVPGLVSGSVPGPAAVPSDPGAAVSMQPSGPIPAIASETVATGSGPHEQARAPAVAVPDPPRVPAAVLPTIAVPRTSAEALEAWHVVLGQLEERKKFSLLAPFQHARVLKWTADQIELGFPVDVHAMGEMAADTKNIDDLRAILRELGAELKNLKVSVRLLDDRESNTAGARSVLETTRDRSSAERTKREAEAREHPITKHVLQTFGAHIKEIKTDV